MYKPMVMIMNGDIEMYEVYASEINGNEDEPEYNEFDEWEKEYYPK